MGGRYSRSQTFVNEGASLGTDADYDDLLSNADAVQDMSAATPYNPLNRPRRQ